MKEQDVKVKLDPLWKLFLECCVNIVQYTDRQTSECLFPYKRARVYVYSIKFTLIEYNCCYVKKVSSVHFITLKGLLLTTANA